MVSGELGRETNTGDRNLCCQQTKRCWDAACGIGVHPSPLGWPDLLKPAAVVSFCLGKLMWEGKCCCIPPVEKLRNSFIAKNERVVKRMLQVSQTSLWLSPGIWNAPQIYWSCGSLPFCGFGTVSRTYYLLSFFPSSCSGSLMTLSSCSSLFASYVVLKHKIFHYPYMRQCRIVLFFHCNLHFCSQVERMIILQAWL